MKKLFILLSVLFLTGCAMTPNYNTLHQDPHYLVPDSVQYDVSEWLREKVTYSADISSIKLVKKDINQFIVTNVTSVSDKNPMVKSGTAVFHQGTCSQGFGFLDVHYTAGEKITYEVNYREWKNTRQVEFVKFICATFQRNVLLR